MWQAHCIGKRASIAAELALSPLRRVVVAAAYAPTTLRAHEGGTSADRCTSAAASLTTWPATTTWGSMESGRRRRVPLASGRDGPCLARTTRQERIP